MIKDLIKLANQMDRSGMFKYANYIDKIIKLSASKKTPPKLEDMEELKENPEYLDKVKKMLYPSRVRPSGPRSKQEKERYWKDRAQGEAIVEALTGEEDYVERRKGSGYHHVKNDLRAPGRIPFTAGACECPGEQEVADMIYENPVEGDSFGKAMYSLAQSLERLKEEMPEIFSDYFGSDPITPRVLRSVKFSPSGTAHVALSDEERSFEFGKNDEIDAGYLRPNWNVIDDDSHPVSMDSKHDNFYDDMEEEWEEERVQRYGTEGERQDLKDKYSDEPRFTYSEGYSEEIPEGLSERTFDEIFKKERVDTGK